MVVDIYPGRNHVEKITVKGKTFCLKKLEGEPTDVQRRFDNSCSWERIRQQMDVRSPRLVEADSEAHVLLYEWVEGAIDFSEALRKGDCSQILSNTAASIAKLHRVDIECCTHRAVPLTYSEFFAIPKSVYASSTGAELQCYSLLHHDKELKETIIAKISAFSSHPVPEDSVIHADLRYDQIVVDESGQICLLDFEEFGLGEKTRDLAGIVGSILFESGLETFQYESNDIMDSQDIDHDIRERGANNFDEALGRCAHFLEEYRTFSGSRIDVGYLAFLTGVFVVRRVLARAGFSYKLSGIDKALLGIGRGLIIDSDLLKI